MNPLGAIVWKKEGMPVERLALIGEQPDPETDVVMWVIHNRLTLDFPGFYVMRRQWIHAGEIVIELTAVASVDIETVRAQLPAGLVCMPPHPGDDHTIEEVWI